MRIDLIDVLTKFAAWLSLDFLDLLETARLHKSAFGLQVLWKDFSELGTNVGQNIVWSKLKKGFESWDMCAHLDDVLKSFF